MQNTLNEVYKDLSKLIKETNNCKNISIANKEIIISYYKIIQEYLLLENKYKDEVETSGKPILHYFLYRLPSTFSFEFLYNPYNPVRFAVETFDSIEIIKQEICKKK